MALRSDEFRIDAVNQALAQVKGLGFALPEGVVKKVGGDMGDINPEALKIEETNDLVEEITKGKLGIKQL